MKYEKAESKVIEFESEDIITASGTVACIGTSGSAHDTGCQAADTATMMANPADFIKL